MTSKRPAPHLPCNCLALRQAARHVTSFYDAKLAPYGLRATQHAMLTCLRVSGPWTIQALAARLVMDRTTLGRNILPLERDGLVSVTPDPADRRSRLVQLTEAGIELIERAQTGWLAAQDRFEDALGTQIAAQLRTILRDVSATRLDE